MIYALFDVMPVVKTLEAFRLQTTELETRSLDMRPINLIVDAVRLQRILPIAR